MQKISTRQMIEMFEAQRGSTFLGLIALTEPRMNKKSRITGEANPFLNEVTGEVELVKVNRLRVQINAHYDGMVSRRVAAMINTERRENGEEELSGPVLDEAVAERFHRGTSWHEAVNREDGTMTPFRAHKRTGVRYLGTLVRKTIGEPRYIDRRTGEVFEGEAIENRLAEFMPLPSRAKNQGLPADREVAFNVWKLSGIRALNMNGQTFRIRPNDEAEAEEVFEVLNEKLAEMEVPTALE